MEKKRIAFKVGTVIDPIEDDGVLSNIGAKVLISKKVLYWNNEAYVHVAAYFGKDGNNNLEASYFGLRKLSRFSIDESFNTTTVSDDAIIQILTRFSDEIKNNIFEKRLKNVPQEVFLKPEKPLSEMTVNELREYATIIREKGFFRYDERLHFLKDYYYKEKDTVEKNLNNEFDRRVGIEFKNYYDLFDKIHNKEKWGGEIRYQLLSYLHKPTTELQCAKAAFDTLSLDLTVQENVLKVMNMVKSLPYGTFNIDNSETKNLRYTDCIYLDNIKKINENSALSLKLEDEFIDSILKY